MLPPDTVDPAAWPFTLYPVGGRIEAALQYMKARSPFDGPGMREEFRQVCNTIGDVEIPEAKIDLRPSVPMDALVGPTALPAAKAALDRSLAALKN